MVAQAVGMKYNPYGVGAALLQQAISSIGSKQNLRYRSGQSMVTTTKKRRKMGSRSSFKRQVMNLHPAKHFTTETSANNTHNTIACMCPTQGITQGDGNTSRDGDAIHIEALKLKGTFATDVTAGAYQQRIIVGWSGEEYTTSNIATQLVGGLGASEIFLPTTSGTWTINGLINPKAFTVLYDETLDANSQISAVRDVVSWAATIPIHQDFNYQSSGSVQGKTRNLYIIAIAAVAGGTTGVTAAGNHILSVDLIFKNA